jgi:hypothetical protein
LLRTRGDARAVAPHYLYAMLLRPEYLSQELDRPLPTKDGGILRTIRDACNYMAGIGKQRELRSHWQRFAKLILAKEDVLTVTRGNTVKVSRARRQFTLDCEKLGHG